MAVPLSEEEVSVNDDIQKLGLAQSYFQMAESAAFKDLMERVQALVDQSQQELFSDMSPDANQIVLLKTRWQQRLLTLQAIRSIIDGQLKTRTDILEEMQQGDMNEYDPNT